jgi:hypothetical protein
MTQYNIHELEARADWPLLVTAVPCRTCEAQPGALCCDVGAHKLSGQIVTRPDYHAERKYDAALAWMRRGEAPAPVTPVSIPPEEQSSAEDTGGILTTVDVANMVADLTDPQVQTPEAPDSIPDTADQAFAGGETGGAGAGGEWSANPESEPVPAPEPDEIVPFAEDFTSGGGSNDAS